jgi:two-component system sensor histidine kinase UhpB
MGTGGKAAFDEPEAVAKTSDPTRRKRLIRLGLMVLAAQLLFWGQMAAPWGPVRQMEAIERIEPHRTEVAEIKAPTPQAADRALHKVVELPFSDCCDPAYYSLKMFFDLDEIPAEGLGLVAYQQVDNFIIRINGSVVHELGRMEFGDQTFHGQLPYLIRLPYGLLKTGENEISYITVRHGYPYTDLGPPLLGSYNQVHDATALRFWQSKDYRLLGGWLTFVLGLFAFILAFRSQDRRFAVWLMVLCWSWTAFAAYGLYLDLPFGGVGRMIAFYAINTAIGCSLLCFIDSWTRKPLPWGQAAVEAAWLVFIAGAVMALHLGAMPTAFDLTSEIWSWFSLALGVLVVARLIWHFATTDEDRHIEAALLSVCAVALMADAIGDKFGLLSGGYMIDVAPLLLLAFVATFVQRNFMLFQSAIGLSAMLETQLQAREAELVQAHWRERELVSIQARAEERRRMMRDMHDGVGGQLVGLLLSVRRGNVDNQRIVDGLQGVMDEIRLMLDTDDSAGATLDAMLNIFETRVRPRIEDAGFTLNWTVERSSSGDLAPQDVLQVFRIMQEAVTNAMKHSQGDAIDIAVTDRQPERLSVSIRDNGVGRLGAEGGGGHGLGNMQDRAEAVGGQLEISDAEPGTMVSLSLPLRVGEVVAA